MERSIRTYVRWLAAAAVLINYTRLGAGEIGLGLPVEGVKTVTISNAVGQNQVRFVSTAPLEEIQGTASDVTGSLTLDPNDLSKITGSIEVGVRSMKTGISRRDDHLFSEDWLDGANYPSISFKLSGVKEISPIDAREKDKTTVEGTVLGSFTLHGVTKELEAPFKATYLIGSEMTARRAPGDLVMVRSSFEIALGDYDVKGVRGLVGSKVGKAIQVEVSLFGSTAVALQGD